MAQEAVTAALYLRVSTSEQANEGISLEAQECRLRAYAQMRGLDIADVICDPGVSAGKALASRPGGARAVDLVNGGKVKAVVAYKLDRLFRDCADCLTVTREWDKRGVALHLVDMGGAAIDTSTAMGRFFLTVLAGAAEMERNLIAERTASAMAHLKETGRHTGGRVRYGYRLGDDGVHLQPRPDEQEVIRVARSLRADGLSLAKIGGALAEQGLRPRSGGRWWPKTVKDVLRAQLAEETSWAEA